MASLKGGPSAKELALREFVTKYMDKSKVWFINALVSGMHENDHAFDFLLNQIQGLVSRINRFYCTIFNHENLRKYNWRLNSYFRTQSGCELDMSILKWSSELLKQSSSYFSRCTGSCDIFDKTEKFQFAL